MLMETLGTTGMMIIQALIGITRVHFLIATAAKAIGEMETLAAVILLLEGTSKHGQLLLQRLA